MLYLLTQIGISLLLAGLLGGSIGWILHRARAGRKMEELHTHIARQQQQVSQAQTEISILSDDYDDLRQRSETQIRELQSEAEKLPALNLNLEKSQLLVRQMLQKHEAETRELNEQNQALNSRLDKVKNHESTITRLQADLDLEKRRNMRVGTDLAAAENNDSTAQTELNLDGSSTAGNSGIPASPSDSHADTAPANDPEPIERQSWASGRVSDVSTAAQTAEELQELSKQLSDDTPAPSAKPATKPAANPATRPAAKTTPAEPAIEPLFDSVEQHDDLKQIFGIGPVTEKTLNKLGITSYSQLAELQKHDIEKIADALQIFPGRIERENWVDGARQQLEEVLEDL